LRDFAASSILLSIGALLGHMLEKSLVEAPERSRLLALASRAIPAFALIHQTFFEELEMSPVARICH
jgi:hypothetical protein